MTSDLTALLREARDGLRAIHYNGDLGKRIDDALSAPQEIAMTTDIALLREIHADLARAEWGTDQHGAELFKELIDKHEPKLRTALSAPPQVAAGMRRDGLEEVWMLLGQFKTSFAEARLFDYNDFIATKVKRELWNKAADAEHKLKEAIRALAQQEPAGEREKGKSRLVYNKATRTIDKVTAELAAGQSTVAQTNYPAKLGETDGVTAEPAPTVPEGLPDEPQDYPRLGPQYNTQHYARAQAWQAYAATLRQAAARLQGELAEAQKLTTQWANGFKNLSEAHATVQIKDESADRTVAELRKDAERYRWLRGSSARYPRIYIDDENILTDEQLDAAIDSALAQPGGKG